jgi:hypothetical protein
MCGPNTVAELNQLEDLFFRLDELFLQTLDLHLLTLVFKQLQTFMVIEQVIDLASIDLIHGYSDCKVPFFFLEVIDTPIEQVLDCRFLQSLHGIGLSRSSLPIGKNSHNPSVEDQVKYRSD